MTKLEMIPVDVKQAAPWIADSLSQGTELAGLVQRRASGVAAAFVAGTKGPPSDVIHHAALFDRAVVDSVFEHFLSSTIMPEAELVLVEDDLARRGDPLIPGAGASSWVYFGDRILRFALADDGAAHWLNLVRTGASGYPLNAFVCDDALLARSLRSMEVIDAETLNALACNITWIINSAYDGESFMASRLDLDTALSS